MKGLRVKVDEKSKSADNVEEQKRELPKVEKEEVKSSNGYKFIRKDSEDKMFLLPETSAELEKMHEEINKCDNDLLILTLKQKSLEKDKEILQLRNELLDREIGDVSTAKNATVARKRVGAIKHAEYMDKIKREVGHQTFGLSEEDEILIKEK